MTFSDLKALIGMAMAAGITPAQLQRLAQDKGIKSNNDLLMLVEDLYASKRAASFVK